VGRQQHTAWLCSYAPCRSISHIFNCGVHVTWQLLSGCIWLSTALLLQQLHHYDHTPEFVCVWPPCRDWVAGVDFHPSGTSLASGSGQTHFQCNSCIDNVHCLGVPTPMQQHPSACIVGAGSGTGWAECSRHTAPLSVHQLRSLLQSMLQQLAAAVRMGQAIL
jgi:hypothetical protein